MQNERFEPGTTVTYDIWSFRDTTTNDLAGYAVEAQDGRIGKIDEATYEVGNSHIVVDTGPWIFGKKVVLPAGVIDQVDSSEKVVFANRTKDEIKNAPEFDEDMGFDEDYRGRLSSYYGGF